MKFNILDNVKSFVFGQFSKVVHISVYNIKLKVFWKISQTFYSHQVLILDIEACVSVKVGSEHVFGMKKASHDSQFNLIHFVEGFGIMHERRFSFDLPSY